MKKLILFITILAASKSFAFEAQLKSNSSMSVNQLVDSGATSVSCESKMPRCVLKGRQFGIRYEGEAMEDVHFSTASTTTYALEKIMELKDADLCE